MLLNFVAAAVLSGAVLTSAPASPDHVFSPSTAPVETWQIDRSHSEISFRIRHFMSRVRGSFTQWSGTIQVDPQNWAGAQVDVTIQTASIDTQQERRDTHLRSNDFFAADSFPTITFRSTGVERTGDAVKLHGLLTMRGVTKAIVLEGRFLGMQNEANGRQRAGFEARTTINRLEYGVTWNRAAEGGGAVLGDDVEIEVALEVVKQAPAAPAGTR